MNDWECVECGCYTENDTSICDECWIQGRLSWTIQQIEHRIIEFEFDEMVRAVNDYVNGA